MAKGTKYTPEFKAKAVRLLAEYRASYFVGDERDRRGGEGAGGRSGDIGALAQPVGRDSRGGVEAVGRGRDGRVHRHARRPHGLVPGQAHQDGVRHEHHGSSTRARSCGMIGGDGINDESNKTAPPPTAHFLLNRHTVFPSRPSGASSWVPVSRAPWIRRASAVPGFSRQTPPR